jgi:hypothetical protein
MNTFNKKEIEIISDLLVIKMRNLRLEGVKIKEYKKYDSLFTKILHLIKK